MHVAHAPPSTLPRTVAPRDDLKCAHERIEDDIGHEHGALHDAQEGRQGQREHRRRASTRRGVVSSAQAWGNSGRCNDGHHRHAATSTPAGGGGGGGGGKRGESGQGHDHDQVNKADNGDHAARPLSLLIAGTRSKRGTVRRAEARAHQFLPPGPRASDRSRVDREWVFVAARYASAGRPRGWRKSVSSTTCVLNFFA